MKLVQESSWIDHIITYLKNGETPKGKTEAQILRLKAARYMLYDDKLYIRGYLMPLLKCVPSSKAEYIMKEVHKDICRNHAGGLFLSFKTLRQGYY